MSLTPEMVAEYGHAEALERLTAIRGELEKLNGFENLTARQQDRFDELVGDAELVNERLREISRETELARVREIASGTRPGALEHGDGARFNDAPVSTSRDAARRAIDRSTLLHDDGKERLTRAFERAEADPRAVHELSTLSRWVQVAGDPAYARAFSKLLRDPVTGHREFSDEELRAFQNSQRLTRAMAIGDGSSGGFMVPTHLDPQIMISNAGVVDPVRQYARVETIATETWNGVSSAGVTASWDGEAVEVSDDSPTLAQPSVPTHKAAAFVAASIEAAGDTSIGEQLATLFADAKTRLEAAAFLTGSGSGQPTGIVSALPSGSKVPADADDSVGADDILAVQAALSPRWQANARWMANLAVLNELAAFETSNGSKRFPELANDRLLRKPVHEHSGLDAPGDTASDGNDNVLLYGDFSQYLIVDRVGATVEFIPHLFGENGRPTGQRGWYLYWRTGADVLIDDAIRLLTA